MCVHLPTASDRPPSTFRPLPTPYADRFRPPCFTLSLRPILRIARGVTMRSRRCAHSRQALAVPPNSDGKVTPRPRAYAHPKEQSA